MYLTPWGEGQMRDIIIEYIDYYNNRRHTPLSVTFLRQHYIQPVWLKSHDKTRNLAPSSTKNNNVNYNNNVKLFPTYQTQSVLNKGSTANIFPPLHKYEKKLRIFQNKCVILQCESDGHCLADFGKFGGVAKK